MSAIRFVLAAIAALAAPPAAGAGVVVSFDQPDGYTDAALRGGHGAKALEPTLRHIRTHLEALGARWLAADQTLTVAVRDIDLAGRYEPWRHDLYDVRILRDVTWPQIMVVYTLSQNGSVLLSGQETIRDLNYLMRAEVRLSSDALRYEKAMLNDWFRARFVIP